MTFVHRQFKRIFRYCRSSVVYCQQRHVHKFVIDIMRGTGYNASVEMNCLCAKCNYTYCVVKSLQYFTPLTFVNILIAPIIYTCKLQSFHFKSIGLSYSAAIIAMQER